MFRIYIETRDDGEQGKSKRTSIINMVDLAGSENIDGLKARKTSQSPTAKSRNDKSPATNKGARKESSKLVASAKKFRNLSP